MKKHDAFETDLAVHRGRLNEMEEVGNKLKEQGNYQSKMIEQKLKHVKVSENERVKDKIKREGEKILICGFLYIMCSY